MHYLCAIPFYIGRSPQLTRYIHFLFHHKCISIHMRQHLFPILFSLILLAGCVYDNEEELLASGDCNTANLSYAKDILPIIETNCYRCHDAANNFGDITLEGYDNLRKWVDSGELLGAIKREPGFSPMPQGASKLGDCLIEQIESWINQGALDN